MTYSLEYAITIIVAAIYEGQWGWYISNRDFWLLDLGKLRRDYLNAGCEVPDDYSYRFNIPIVNQETASLFLEQMKQYRVNKSVLSDMALERVRHALSWEDVIDLCPALLVDFDRKKLSSLFPEPIKFERYVPDDWYGQYEDFYHDIPVDEKYWVIDGIDYFEKFS